jgi:hypothetical protein
MNAAKQYTVSLIITLGCFTSGFAQGTVLFKNEQDVVYRYSWHDEVLRPVPAIPAWFSRVQLAYAPAGTPYSGYQFLVTEAEWLARNAGWTLGPSTPIVQDGLFDGGAITFQGIASGADADFVVFGWAGSATMGVTNFFEAFGGSGVGWYGIYGPLRTRTGDASAPVSLGDSLPLLVLLPAIIPEPSIPVLGLLGLGAVWFRRCREDGSGS